ncbi:MAG: DUF2911 domain-containing protein [Acidobacteriota bacterium]|nr:DUF2911 domain-containing protein [Acidobacteriota bacterium]
MRRYATVVIIAAVGLSLAGLALAANPRGLAKVEFNGQAVSIDYGRPSLHGRTIDQMLGELKPGGFWRLGADSSTTYTAATDLKFGDVTVPKGTYSLWAKRTGQNSWELVFNTAHGMWGTMHAQHAATDKYFVPLEETKASSPQDLVTITIAKHGSDAGAIDIVWGDLELMTHFTAS